MIFTSLAARIVVASAIFLGASVAALGQTGKAILTYHNNYQRWGWNAAETILTPSTFTSGSGTFGVIATVNTLDGLVSAQPLIVPNANIYCPAKQAIVTCKSGSSGIHNVVYVATWNNTVYAIDADTGAILLTRNFGKQGVPTLMTCPGGMLATPVIDPVKGIMYILGHVANDTTQSYKLYAVDIGTLADAVTPFTITKTNTFSTLTNGTTYGFSSQWACQRAALLLVGGKIFAAFSGLEYEVGDATASGPSRGWVLGWNGSDLSPLPPLLTDAEATAPNKFFLSSIWMSSAGVASDGTSLYFSTGNSDPSGKSYNSVKNIEESVVKVTSSLTVSSTFTPSNYAEMDLNDLDLGSGGVMVLPGTPPLVVAAGKDGRMFLLNGDSLGGYTLGGPDHVLDVHDIGGCWCAPSFFEDQNGSHVVSSGGNALMSWKVTGSATGAPKLVQEAGASIASLTPAKGFFTFVSSNGANSAVIWAVGRPVDNANTLTLYAFDGTHLNGGTLPLLGSYSTATSTPGSGSLPISMPVVSNGKVYVVGGNAGTLDGLTTTPFGTLTIFGVLPKAASGRP